MGEGCLETGRGRYRRCGSGSLRVRGMPRGRVRGDTVGGAGAVCMREGCLEAGLEEVQRTGKWLPAWERYA